MHNSMNPSWLKTAAFDFEDALIRKALRASCSECLHIFSFVLGHRERKKKVSVFDVAEWFNVSKEVIHDVFITWQYGWLDHNTCRVDVLIIWYCTGTWVEHEKWSACKGRLSSTLAVDVITVYSSLLFNVAHCSESRSCCWNQTSAGSKVANCQYNNVRSFFGFFLRTFQTSICPLKVQKESNPTSVLCSSDAIKSNAHHISSRGSKRATGKFHRCFEQASHILERK